MLKLFPLHQQQSKQDLFELVLWMQNNTKNQREKKIMPRRGKGIVVGGRGVVGSEKGRRGRRGVRMCVGLCIFMFVCFFPLHMWNLKLISVMECKG